MTKLILRAMLAASVAAYGIDCGEAVSADQAMQCCKSMPCSSHGHHGQECCKAMHASHSPFVLTASAHAAQNPQLAAATLPRAAEHGGTQFAAIHFSARSHAPPDCPSSLAQPLRI